MDYAPYVIFRENNTIHARQYLMRGEENKLIPTKNIGQALRFETSRMAYEFGRQNRLTWWKVGKH